MTGTRTDEWSSAATIAGVFAATVLTASIEGRVPWAIGVAACLVPIVLFIAGALLRRRSDRAMSTLIVLPGETTSASPWRHPKSTPKVYAEVEFAVTNPSPERANGFATARLVKHPDVEGLVQHRTFHDAGGDKLIPPQNIGMIVCTFWYPVTEPTADETWSLTSAIELTDRYNQVQRTHVVTWELEKSSA